MSVELIRTLHSDIEPADHPYLQGAWTPLLEEVNATDMRVLEGKIPDDLDGVYLRNTQNPVYQSIGRYHPFDGDGMLHMISFKDGKAEYRNRFVQTKGLTAEQEAGKRLWAGLMEDPRLSARPGWGAHGSIKDASSTDVVVHAGKAFTSYYQCGEGYRLDPFTLEQLGIPAWSPLDGVSAHMKVDPATGEMLFFNYSKHAPYMHYGVVDRNDQLVHYVPVPLPGPRLPHDMAFSEHYAILNDFPLYWDPELLKQGKHVVKFHPDQPSRFAIIPRRGQPQDIRWFEAAPTFVLHFLNAYEEGDEIVLDGYFQEEPEPKNFDGAPKGYERMMSYLDQYKMKTRLHRWRFNLATGKTTEQRLDDRTLEFGMINQRYAGFKYRYAYSAVQVPGWFLFHGYVKHDLETGQSWEVRLPEGQYASEAPFAPRIDAKDEDDGYLVTFITNENTQRSECLLIDCKRFDEGPVCRIELPHKLCSGTHSCWAAGTDVRDGLLSAP
ncbi:MAG: carotenoid oxygenase family protein [Burkholderiaceae bacterium]